MIRGMTIRRSDPKREFPSIQAAYQLHKNAAITPEQNTAAELIANSDPAGGQFVRVTVAADGKLLSVEDEVALADVPAAVRQTIQAQATGGKLGTLEMVTEDGKTTFEAKVEKDGKKLEITIAPDGKITGTEDVTKEKD